MAVAIDDPFDEPEPDDATVPCGTCRGSGEVTAARQRAWESTDDGGYAAAWLVRRVGEIAERLTTTETADGPGARAGERLHRS